MPALRIIGAALLGTLGYGVVHEGVTTLVSPEHITIGHVDLMAGYLKSLRPSGLFSPFQIALPRMALQWALVHTLFFGLVLGSCLAFAARVGRRPKLIVADLWRPLGMLLVCMAAGAALAAAAGALLAAGGQISMPRVPTLTLPADRQTPYISMFWMHTASYAVGIVGAAVIVVWTWSKRSSANLGSGRTSPV